MKQIKNWKFDTFNGIATVDFEVNKNSKFVIISYWWGKGNVNKNSRKSLTYDQLADRLIQDCYKTKCNYCFVEVPEFAVPGGYQKAINFKPTFIKEFITNYIPDNIPNVLYIDTDMSIKKHPYVFEMLGYDFIGYNWNWEPRQIYGQFPSECWDPFNLHTSGGIMMYSNSSNSKELLDKWESFVKKYPGKAEDRMLSIPFNDDMLITKLRCFWLSNEYFWLPYFYEYDDEFQVEKQYQKSFKKLGITFKDEVTEEMNFKDFFNIKTKDLVITHPEMLTSEEMAAKEGADLNRVPLEWFKSQGRKKRCLTNDNIFTINENLYFQSSKQKSGIIPSLDWLKNSEFIKLSDKDLTFDPIKLDIIKKNIQKGYDFLILGISNEHSEESIDNWIEIVGNTNYCIVNKGKHNLAKIIYSVMKKFNKDVIHLALECETTSNFEEFDFENSDIACLNSNAFPYYKSTLKEKCRDERILNCVTTDLLYFRNNRFGKNILKAWNKEFSKNISEEQCLSLAFNKYLLVIPSRCKWLDPGYAYNKKYVSYLKGYNIKILTPNKFPRFIKKIGIADYLQQCGEKRGVSLLESPYKTHYTGSKLKKIGK
jgi:hypothetical protein